MQPIEEIEKYYETEDPWGYQNNPEDIKRKKIIIKIAETFCEMSEYRKYINLSDNEYYEYERCLDIGCGEGWITYDLPSDYKYGYEISKNASSRFPNKGPFPYQKVFDIKFDSNYSVIFDPKSHYKKNSQFDLVIATGVLYKHYDYKHFIEIINRFSDDIILTCNIKEWEVPEIKDIQAKQIFEAEFHYREYTQKLRVFKR